MKEISKKWTSDEFALYHYYFPYDIKEQICKMRYYIMELALTFVNKEKIMMFNYEHYLVKKKTLHQK